MRLRRIHGTEEKLHNATSMVICHGNNMAGKWSEHFGNNNPIYLEIGCGRGNFITSSARKNPDINYVAVELQGEVVADCLSKVEDDFPKNLCLLWQNAAKLRDEFGKGEVKRIYLHFSDPWPKRKHYKRRLTYRSFLEVYKDILADDGEIIIKTDMESLYRFSCNQLLQNGFTLNKISEDYPAEEIQTEYEKRFRQKGQNIYYIHSTIRKEVERTMKYVSTRNNEVEYNAAYAIRSGLAEDGGLYVPVSIPKFSYSFDELKVMDYQTLAKIILGMYLTDFSKDRISDIVDDTYNFHNFEDDNVAPLIGLSDKMNILELWHGPTAAFKDMALQIMPKLLCEAVKIEGGKGEVDILVATSGDTGKAALEGFKNIEGLNVICFYPYQGVSKVQELQMTTTDGANTNVVAVRGNFDDCQSAVKRIFEDKDFAKLMADNNKEFSSANSINWGRLLPQIVYYFWSYRELLHDEKVKAGEKFNVVVPTGNFGNILAAYYAREMGLPIDKLICASNSNKVLTDVLNTGVYDRRRDFVKTTSPSMDILVSSNFERFYYAMSNGNDKQVKENFTKLKKDGVFTAEPEVMAKWQEFMYGGYAKEGDVKNTIGRILSQYDYVVDPHTAVAIEVYEDYRDKTGDNKTTVIASTASPYKFPQAVLDAFNVKDEFASSEEMLEKLSDISNTDIHRGLKGLENKKVLHNTVVDVNGIDDIVKVLLNL